MESRRKMNKRIKVIVSGVGEMGGQAVKMILEKPDLELVGVIGHKKGVGEDVARKIGLDKDTGIIISADADKIFETVDADIVLNFGSSTVKEAYSQIERALTHGINVITIAELASYPWITEKEMSEEIDKKAKLHGVTFLGTGINPGFMFDYLPITITGALKKTSKIYCRRVVDFSRYGISVWEHIGAGKAPEEFNKGIKNGDIVLHVGLKETVHIVADAMCWKLDNYTETKNWMVSKSRREAEYGIVEPGTVCGFKQVAKGYMNGKEVIVQEIIGIIKPNLAEDGADVGTSIMIDSASSSTKISIEGELAAQGGWGTVARAVNSIPQVLAAQPGIVTVNQLPPSPCLPDTMDPELS
jgi:hypothetical protein